MFKITILGCVNNLSKNKLNEYQKRLDEFKICQGIECNSRTSFEKCLICNSANHPNCVNNTEYLTTKICKNYVNECFTLIGSKNISRGCLNDFDDEFQALCRNDASKCETCSTLKDDSGCNEIPFVLETCISCDSSKDNYCENHLEKAYDKICNRIQPPDQNGCYLKKVGKNRF